MIYPKFLTNKSKIGVTAPSDGITKETDIIRINNAIKNLEKEGFTVEETKNVRTSKNNRSSSPKERAKQLEELFKNKDIDLILSASGGEFLMEMIPFLNYKVIKENPKWFQGYSDPTWLTYTITTNLDIATIYSNNYKAFGMKKPHKSILNNIDILKGKNITQTSFLKYEKEKRKTETGLEEYNLTEKVNWKIITKENEVKEKGRIIGGCLDVISDIVGTKYDKTKEFIEKYKQDGIIWYLENFSLSAENITRLLWKLKENGYFKYTKLIIFGRNCMYTSIFNKTFEETVKESLKDLKIPIIIDVDIGHIAPRITIINGAIANITTKDGKGKISFELK